MRSFEANQFNGRYNSHCERSLHTGGPACAGCGKSAIYPEAKNSAIADYLGWEYRNTDNRANVENRGVIRRRSASRLGRSSNGALVLAQLRFSGDLCLAQFGYSSDVQ
jgi:hypothetical protein